MVELTSLWLPILLSAVFVFVASSVIHMAAPLHRNDWAKLPAEDAVCEAIRASGAGPGNYMFPHCGADWRSDEAKAKFERGPVGFVTLRGGMPSMGAALGQWFALTLLVGIFVAYITAHAVPAGSDYLRVFQVAGAVAFVAYGTGTLQESIWKGLRWSTSFKFVFDALVYSLVTAGTFGWLWPR